MIGNRRVYLYYAMLFLVAFAAMWPVATLQHPLKYDMIDQAYPWRYFIGECLQEGMLPLWNPYQLLGSPIHADPQSSAWYPVTWFFGHIFGYDIHVISFDFLLHIFLAGMGMFYLARQLKFRHETAFLMGMSYMLSGFFIGNAQHFMWIISGTWIPFITGAFIALKEKPSLAGALQLGLAFFMIMTGGYPAFVFILAYFLALMFILYAVEYLRKKEFRQLTRLSAYLVISGIYALLAAMVVLVSVFHLQDAMTRGEGVTLKQALFGAFTPQSFISFVIPFASIREMEFYGTDLSMSNAYFGLVLLVFFLSGLMIRRTRLVNLFLAWGLFCLSAAVGSALPVREFLYDYVPFMNLFRFPALFRIFVIMSFIVVAGFAFNEWRKGIIQMQWKIKISLLLTIMVIAALIIHSLARSGLDMSGFMKNQLFIHSEKSSIAQHIVFQGAIQLVLLLLFILLLMRWRKMKFALAVIFFLAVSELVLSARLNGPYTIYYQIFRSADIHMHAAGFPDGFPLPDSRPVILNRDTKGLGYQALWRNMNIFHRQVSFEGYNPLHLKGFEEIADNHAKLFETVLQNPPVYLAGRISPIDSLAFHVADSNFYKERVYFEEEDYLMLNVEGLMLNEGDSITMTAFSPVEVKVVCRTGDKVLLNLLQNNYYGWEAKIDGQPAEIYTANMSFIAVPVPAGEHEVVFTYDPKGVRVGFWISLITVLTGITVLIIKSFYLTAEKAEKAQR